MKTLPQEINILNSELAILRANYTEKSQPIKNILKKRSKLLESLKDQIKSYLVTKKFELNSEIESNTRDEGIILTFKDYRKDIL